MAVAEWNLFLRNQGKVCRLLPSCRSSCNTLTARSRGIAARRRSARLEPLHQLVPVCQGGGSAQFWCGAGRNGLVCYGRVAICLRIPRVLALACGGASCFLASDFAARSEIPRASDPNLESSCGWAPGARRTVEMVGETVVARELSHSPHAGARGQ